MGFIAFLFIVQYLMGLSILIAASRQMWAFSRDGALPFSSFFRPIVSSSIRPFSVFFSLSSFGHEDPTLTPFQSKTFGYIPLRAVWGAVFVAVILGLLSLIASAAASALFSLAVAGNNLAWGLPIFARAVWGRDRFVPGPFYTGHRFSLPVAWAAIIFLVFGILLAMFPGGGPDPAAESMNYTVVVNMAVWGGASIYYFVDARKWFTGPKTTVGEVEAITGHVLTGEQRDGLVDKSEGSAGETEKRVVVNE